jgi:ubiquinone/menaquinone biosynthesis C-methylase UbiE
MTEYHPTNTGSHQHHDYLPAAGRDGFLPFYDLFTTVLGVPKVHRTLIDQAGLAAGQRVLEIGCGTGNLTVRAKRSHPGVEVVGSDPDPLALGHARRRARGLDEIRFEQGYAQRLPYPDATFDRVLSALMLHHIDQDDQPSTAAEIARVLRPGGSVHLVDLVDDNHGIHGFLARRMKSGHLAGNSEDDIPRLLGSAGLECAEVASRRHPFMGRIIYYRATRPA